MPKFVKPASRTIRAHRLIEQAVEIMEPRLMLSVAQNSAGWTVVTPEAGDRVIYVSSSSGKDSNSGLSPQTPVQSLAHANSLMRNHTGDEMLLKAGDIFYGNFVFWTNSGRSAQDPMVLGSYGSGSRPEMRTGTRAAIETGSLGAPEVNFIDIMGINFDADARNPNLTNSPASSSNPTGIDILTKSNGILVENCEFQYYDVNLNFQDFLGPISNVSVRRNVIVDAYATNTHAEGMYATGVSNLTVEGNVFDKNGYSDQVGGAGKTMFNHDCYLAADNSNVIVRDNIFSRASAFGLQVRSGGIVQNNIFIDDPVGLAFGLVNGATTTPGGVTGTVSGNVFLGGGDIGKLAGGQGLEIGNVKSATISNNIFADGGDNSSPAVLLTVGTGISNPAQAVGINNLTLSNNIIYNWSTGIVVNRGQTAGGTGLTALNNITFSKNQFENLTGPSLENHGNYLGEETFTENVYYKTNNWILNGVRSAPQGTTLGSPIAFSNPNRSVASYDASIGNSGSTADFLSLARKQSQANWISDYEGATAAAYIEQGFNLGSTTPPPDDTGLPPGSPAGGTARPATTTTFVATKFTADKGIVGDGFSGIGSNGGNWAEYAGIDFGSGVSKFSANIAAMSKFAGSIQLRLDGPTGKLIGTLKVAGTGAWNKYVQQSTRVSGATGVHNFYLVFVGSGGTGNVQSFTFSNSSTTQTPPPITTSRPAKTTTFTAMQFTADKGIVSDHYSGIGSNGGNWAEYANIDFGTGVKKFSAYVAALTKFAGSIQLRLDSPTGKLVGTLKVAGTGAWNKYVQQSTTVSGATGVHNLYLVFVGGGGTGNVKSFTFA